MGGQACKDEIAAPRQGGARNDNKGLARNDNGTPFAMTLEFNKAEHRS